MVLFPHSKINLGLNIVRRRPDGYHDLQTVMLPIGWSDILEVVPSSAASSSLTTSGRRVDCPPEKNLVMKAFRAVEERVGKLPSVDIYLRKIVPDGAGLGGGSADAAAMVKALDGLFSLGLDEDTMCAICAEIGADCPFFIHDRPMLASGTGTSLQPVEIPGIKGMHIVVAKPDVSVTTAMAYANVKPSGREINLTAIVSEPVTEWRNLLKNDFEDSIFPGNPEIEAIKKHFYDTGAVYAAMSGSGSAVFALYENDILSAVTDGPLKKAVIWTGTMD